jgi:ribosome biogenesis GTPase
MTPYVGDDVVIEIQDAEEGVVDEILPRRNSFIRPPVANVDLLIAVIAARRPSPNLEILDRFLVMAEDAGVSAAVCVNKTDLDEAGAGNMVNFGNRQRFDPADPDAHPMKLQEIQAVYGTIYPVLQTSAKTNAGIDRLKQLIAGRRAAFAGPSGVGKSSLINLLLDASGSENVGLTTGSIETGAVSDKTGRGKHTTRHVEIFETDFGAEILDTPGYTSFNGALVDEAELDRDFPEFAPYREACRFDDCRHLHEPGCGILGALTGNRIAPSRYATYVKMLGEAQERNKKGIKK